jgi:hypothetical protein
LEAADPVQKRTQTGLGRKPEIIVPNRLDLADGGPQFNRGSADLVIQYAPTPRPIFMNAEKIAGRNQVLQIATTFKGSILFPPKCPEHAFYCQSTAIHRQRILIFGIVNASGLPHPFDRGPRVFFTGKLHGQEQPIPTPPDRNGNPSPARCRLYINRPNPRMA